MIEQPTPSTQSLISGLRLRNFKSVAEADVDLGPLTILVGMNSSGKSSVLQAIRLVQQGTQDATGDGVFPLNGRLIRMGTITDVRTIQAAEETAVGIGLDVLLADSGMTVGWDISLEGEVPGDQASTFLRQVTVSIPSSEGHDTRITVLRESKSRRIENKEVWNIGTLQPDQSVANPTSLVGGRLDISNGNGRSQFEVTTELRHLVPDSVIIEQPALAAVITKQIDEVLSSQHAPKGFFLTDRWLSDLISTDAIVIDDNNVTSVKDLWNYQTKDNGTMCVVTRDRSGMLLGQTFMNHVVDVDDRDGWLHERVFQFGDYTDCDNECWEKIQLKLSWQVASTPEEFVTSLADLFDIYILRWSYGIDLDTLNPVPLGIEHLQPTGLIDDYLPPIQKADELGKLPFRSFFDLVFSSIFERVALTRQLRQKLEDPRVRNKVATQLTEQLKSRISNKTWTSHLPISFKGRSRAIAHRIESGKTINHPWDSSDQKELCQTGKALEQIGEQIQYLGPLREEPKAASEAAAHHPRRVGPRGEDTAAVIRAHAHAPVTAPLPTRATPTSTTLIEALRAWVKHLGLVQDVETENLAALGLALRVKPHGMENKLPLTSVGVGVSQLLPVLVLCLLSKPGSVILLEQPELHLHPALQQRLADFFIAISRSGRQLIVETHSEYMLSRLRRRIAEDPEDQLLDVAKIIFAERDRTTGLSTFRNIDLTPYGNMTEWPKGFFDQASEDERQTIIEGLKKRRRQNPTAAPIPDLGA
ncbi:MAG: DUF3696 domain-containing protein [bacterium]|nr:DUF3696 domain-containing protein [bacterium]